jgi:hypothetical protein
VSTTTAGRQRDGQGAGEGVPVAEDVDTGVHATLEDLARAKGIGKTYVSQVLRLTLLSPGTVEAILDGRQPAELQLDDLLKGFPLAWDEAAQVLIKMALHLARSEET